MADMIPLKLGSNNELSRFQDGDSLGVAHGGTGSSTAAGARTNLGLAIGTDVQEHDDKLDTLVGTSGEGILVQDGAGGWYVRSLAVASSSRLVITNASGTDGNPTIDLAPVTDSGTGSFKKVTVDGYGRVTGTANVLAADITTLLDGTYVKTAGDTLTGFLTLHADPTNALHAVTKQYVDNLFSSGGVPPFASARAASESNITLSGTQTIDGVALVAGDRVLVKGQTNASQNGIYVVASGAWTRATDADSSDEFTAARQVFVQEGVKFAKTGWAVGNATQPVVGTDPITFTQVSGANQYTAGNGIALDGTQFSAVGVAGQITVNGSGIGLATSGVSAGTWTKVTVDVYGRVTSGSSATPSDIGAQPADSTLTALAGFNSNGFMVQTAADTFAARTITAGTGITVTNGNGAGGNPTIGLEAGVMAAPGTYNSVTVDTYGRVTGGTINATDQIITPMTNGHTSAITIGRVVYVSGNDTVNLANANNYATSQAVGIVTSPTVAAGATANIAVAGVVSATMTQWDAVTGQSGGLTTGAKYYVSNTTAGALTTTAPTSGVLAPVGIALSSTKLALNIQRVVIL